MRKRVLFYFLGFLSALFSVLMVSVDTYISTLMITDPWIYGNASFLVGTIISWILVGFLMVPIGKKQPAKILDPNFQGFRLLEKEEFLFHVYAGLGNAISTAGYFLVVVSSRDPSTVLPFSQLVILYLMIGDFIVEKDPPSFAEVEALTVITFGALLASLTPYGEFRLQEFLIVMLVINVGKVLQVLAQRKLRQQRIRGKRNDSITIRLWNLIFTTLFFYLISFLVAPYSVLESIRVSLDFFLPISGVMLLAFMANVTYIRALGIGKSSVTQAISSLSILMGLPASYVLYYISPEVFPAPAVTPIVLSIRIIGMVFVVLGIISLAISEVRAIILIKTAKGFGETTLKEIWKIKGVSQVSAVAGEYDFIVKVKLRALGKAYSRIIRRIEKIQGIIDYEWMSILKEVEEI